MNKTILVIEDEETLGKSIKSFLEQYGYQVTCTNDGMTGLQLIRDTTPGMVLTDLLLPKLHGFDICKSMKNDNRLKDIPIIIMTAVYKNAIHKLEARKLGVEDFIEKPLNFSELLKKVEVFLGPAQKNKPEKTGPLLFDESASDQFRDLREDYTSRLPQKIMELEQLWANIQIRKDAINRGAQLEKFRRMVHTLSGSGATFGFKEISDHALQLEELLDILISEGFNPQDEKKNKIDWILDNMRHHPVISTGIEVMRQTRTIH